MVNQNDKVDIITVANLANVSPATVSRAFNHPHLVRLETRKRIEKVIEESGYIRNCAAQAMHGKRSGTIGLIVPTVTNAIFSEMIQSFTDAISENGFTLLMATHGFNLRREYEILRKLPEHRVDGVALIGLDHVEATYQLIERQGVPTVAGWNYSESSRISCIGADNREAGAVAAEHLVLLVHRRIGMTFPELDGNDRARMRFEGALSVFSSSGIDTPESFRARSPYDFGRAKAVSTEILGGPNRPTALLCGNDVIALGSIYAARQLGLDVPDMRVDCRNRGFRWLRGLRACTVKRSNTRPQDRNSRRTSSCFRNCGQCRTRDHQNQVRCRHDRPRDVNWPLISWGPDCFERLVGFDSQ